MLNFFLGLAMAVSTAAQTPGHTYDLKSKPHVRVKGNETPTKPAEKIEKTEVLPPPPETPEVGPVVWGGEARYQIRTDLADPVSPRVYVHTVDLSYGFKHVPTNITVVVGAGASYESVGERRSEINVDENQAELFLNNVAIGVQKGWKSDGGLTFRLDLANEFPTSPEARLENYNSVSSIGGTLIYPLIAKKLSVSASTEAYYIWNSSKFSPTSQTLNKQGAVKGVLGVRWKVWRGFVAAASAGGQVSQYLDGTSDSQYRNAGELGYEWTSFAVFASISNGTYLDRGDANVWFIDDYRRIVALRAQLSF